MKNIDYTIYYVTDENLLHEKHDLYSSIEQSILGGATIIQLREKESSTKDFYQKAIKAKEICQKYNVPLIINDRIDIAMAIDSDGIHLGQDDMPLDIARKLLGKEKIIGISVSTIQEALEAQKNGANYLGVGAMYATSTKKDTDIVSISTLSQIKKSVNIPVVAIGGINQTTIPNLAPALVDGVAIVSAISLSQDPSLATRKLKNLFLKQYQTKVVIFDIDGTLVETMKIWDKVIINLMKQLNFKYDEEDLKKIWDMEFVNSAKYTISKFNLDIDVYEFLKTLEKLSIQEYKNANITLKKGAKELLEKLKQKNIKLAIASSLSKNQYEVILEKTGIKHYFDTIKSSIDLSTKKSESLIFETIAKELNVPYTNIVFFEDDINSAKGAKPKGIKMCQLYSEKYKDNHTLDHLIDYKIQDFEDKALYDEIIVF